MIRARARPPTASGLNLLPRYPAAATGLARSGTSQIIIASPAATG